MISTGEQTRLKNAQKVLTPHQQGHVILKKKLDVVAILAILVLGAIQINLPCCCSAEGGIYLVA